MTWFIMSSPTMRSPMSPIIPTAASGSRRGTFAHIYVRARGQAKTARVSRYDLHTRARSGMKSMLCRASPRGVRPPLPRCGTKRAPSGDFLTHLHARARKRQEKRNSFRLVPAPKPYTLARALTPTRQPRSHKIRAGTGAGLRTRCCRHCSRSYNAVIRVYDLAA